MRTLEGVEHLGHRRAVDFDVLRAVGERAQDGRNGQRDTHGSIVTPEGCRPFRGAPFRRLHSGGSMDKVPRVRPIGPVVRTYDHTDFSVDELLAAKAARSVSV